MYSSIYYEPAWSHLEEIKDLHELLIEYIRLILHNGNNCISILHYNNIIASAPNIITILLFHRIDEFFYSFLFPKEACIMQSCGLLLITFEYICIKIKPCILYVWHITARVQYFEVIIIAMNSWHHTERRARVDTSHVHLILRQSWGIYLYIILLYQVQSCMHYVHPVMINI